MSDEHKVTCETCPRQEPIRCPNDATSYDGPLPVLLAELGRIGWIAALHPGPPNTVTDVLTYCSWQCVADHAAEVALEKADAEPVTAVVHEEWCGVDHADDAPCRPETIAESDRCIAFEGCYLPRGHSGAHPVLDDFADIDDAPPFGETLDLHQT